jgi:hypothetical protein
LRVDAVVALVGRVVDVAGALTGGLVTVGVERELPVDVVDAGWLGVVALTKVGAPAGGGAARRVLVKWAR